MADRPATPRQILYMQERSIWYGHNCTQAEATRIITAWQEQNDPADDLHPMDQGDHGDH